MHRDGNATAVCGILVVKQRQAGPVLYAKWRDGDGRQVMRRLGAGWLVRVGGTDARPRGQRVGSWVERRGRPPAGVLDVRSAHAALSKAIDAHEAEQSRAGTVASRGAERRTVAQAGEAWLHHGRAEREWKRSTALDYADVVRRICRGLGARPLMEVSEGELKRFLDELAPERNGQPLDRPPSARMRAKYAVVLRGIFGIAQERGWVARNPALQLSVVRRRRASKNHPLRRDEYLVPDEIHAIVQRAGERDGVDAALVLTLAFAGLRLGEGLALRWRDVDFERSVLRIEENWTRGRTGTPKGGAARTVPMADEIAEALTRLADRPYLTGPDDLVFIGQRGGHVDVNRFRARFYRVQRELGVTPRRTLHQLRHTFATVCASHGIPLRTIQGWCGHEDYATTERYAHFLPRHEDAALISAAFRASPSSPQSRDERIVPARSSVGLGPTSRVASGGAAVKG